jgi:MFS family permease
MALKNLLGRKYVKRLLLARFISNFGNGMGPIAIAFGILHLKGGSASTIGYVLGSQAISMIVMSPFGGVLADKFGRIRMVAICDIWGSL